MKVFLDKHAIGLDRSVIVEDDIIKFSDIVSAPEGFWHLQDRAHMSLKRVADSTGAALDTVPDDPRVNWWLQFDSHCRYDFVLGKDKFLKYLNRVIKQAKSVVETAPYYTSTYQRQNALLDKLRPAHIRQDEESIDLAGVLGIAHTQAGECEIASYDNYSSSTGRMSIKTGPKILTMNKSHRHVFESRWKDEGILLGVDYNALEPRFLLNVMGTNTSGMDVYNHIGAAAKITSIPRETLKTMILACLYGMARRNFIVKFIDTPECDVAYDALREVLGVDYMLSKIKEGIVEGKIKNHFGRPLSCDNESVMLNHFTQSSAVDVACDGFLEFVSSMSDVVEPIFLIHDELVVDVRKDSLEKVTDFCKNGLYVPILETRFPVKTKVFNARKDH